LLRLLLLLNCKIRTNFYKVLAASNKYLAYTTFDSSKHQRPQYKVLITKFNQ